jgi:GT2 family glycosyltransferase
MGGPYVSVVIPTHNRPKLLARCLDALAQQTYPAHLYEVIVVVDGGLSEAQPSCQVQILSETCLANGAPLRVLGTPHGGPARARNYGWRAARGEIIAFTDDDVVPTPGWLEAGVGAFEAGVVGVAGWTEVPTPEVPTDHELTTAGLEDTPFVTCNVFYRRSAIACLGGFDERFRLAWREDSDFYFRLCETGARLVIAPDAVVVHPPRPVRFAHSLFDHRKLLYDALLYQQHPDLYRTLIRPSPPWPYYGILAALVVLLMGVVSWQPGLMALGLGAWLLLTARFCRQRLEYTSHQPRHVFEMVVTSALIPPVAIFWRLAGAIKWRVWFI